MVFLFACFVYCLFVFVFSPFCHLTRISNIKVQACSTLEHKFSKNTIKKQKQNKRTNKQTAPQENILNEQNCFHLNGSESQYQNPYLSVKYVKFKLRTFLANLDLESA